MNDLGIAFELLGVGMISVFVILALVVLLGDLIIRIVNRYMPEMEKVTTSKTNPSASEIYPKKMAAIASAVKTVTNGTGRITTIEKL